jgi:hypothetical protein
MSLFDYTYALPKYDNINKISRAGSLAMRKQCNRQSLLAQSMAVQLQDNEGPHYTSGIHPRVALTIYFIRYTNTNIMLNEEIYEAE